MNAERINICTIDMNEGEGRQTISWDTGDGKLYSDAQEEPAAEGMTFGSIEEAEDAAWHMWGMTWGWNLEWIEA